MLSVVLSILKWFWTLVGIIVIFFISTQIYGLFWGGAYFFDRSELKAVAAACEEVNLNAKFDEVVQIAKRRGLSLKRTQWYFEFGDEPCFCRLEYVGDVVARKYKPFCEIQ